MTTDEARYAGRSAEATAEDIATGLADQQERVAALGVGIEPGGIELSSALGEIDVAHEELRVAEEELRAQQRRLDGLLAERSDPHAWRRGLVRSLPVAALITNLSGTVVDGNTEAWQLFGGDRDGMVGQRLHDLVAVDQVERVGAALDRVRSTVRTHGVSLLLPSGASLDLVVGSDGTDDPESLATWVAGAGRPGVVPDPETGLRTAQAFAQLCGLPLKAEDGLQKVLARAALLVEQAIPTSDGVSITLGPPSEPEAQATDSGFAQAVDGAQLQAGEGPCLSAYETGTVTVCEDLGTDPRWERLAALAQPLGVMAVLGCPIRTERHSLGVLNIYARRTDAFDERDRVVADLLVQAVLAVVQETRDRRELTQLSGQLRQALESRAVIEQAKGILMGRDGTTADQAFTELVTASRRQNIKVRDIARLVLDQAIDTPQPDRGGTGEAIDR